MHQTAALLPAPPGRLRQDGHRGDQAVPGARVAPRGAPRARPDLRHRGDRGPARAGHRQRGRHGAVAEAFLDQWLGPEIVDHHTYALVGDGCLQEGVGQEVISLTGHLRLGKLVFLWDGNRMTDDGAIDIALRDDMPARFRVSGWHVQEVDGHDAEAVAAAIQQAKTDPQPSHAMGAMLYGMAAHGGVVACSVTYLVFTDYMWAAMRMAAMMGLPVLFVFSHDSIGIGTNGPTHQPVEYLASFRAMPNMLVLRPAGAVEAAECWEIALDHRTGPPSLIFARQPLMAVRTGHGEENLSARGAYVLAEAEGGARRATILATGSEVAPAVEARALLQAEGVPAAVVSMPSWDLFERQDGAYRGQVIGRGTVRVAVEAAMRLGWDSYVGEDGGFVGMSGYGASGPEDQLFAHFGITPDRVAAEVRKRL